VADVQSLAQVVHGALERHGVLSPGNGWRVELAPAGSTDRTFRVLDPAGRPAYTARLARPGLAHELLHEEAVLRELAVAGREWTPRQIRRIDDTTLPEGHLLLHEHMPGTPRRLETTAAAASLGEALAWVHGHLRPGYVLWPSLDLRHGTRADAIRARMATLRRYQAARASLPDTERLLQRIATVDLPPDAGWSEPGFALLHGDLSVGNILWDEDRVSLIDWEYARDGDPAEDLAYLIAEQDAAPDVVAELADIYVVVGGDPWALARMPVWLPLVALDAALWWADYRLQRGDDPATDSQIERRLRQATRYLG
jgi:Ser/Thr protein kinase RdoA (MazF antagonist)